VRLVLQKWWIVVATCATVRVELELASRVIFWLLLLCAATFSIAGLRAARSMIPFPTCELQCGLQLLLLCFLAGLFNLLVAPVQDDMDYGQPR
jgi:hypothetical protein